MNMLRWTLLLVIGSAFSAFAGQATTPAAGSTPTRTEAEVKALIQKIGSTPPDWLASTPLNYPKTLDVSFKPPPKGSPWDTNKWISQYFWSVVNENPGKWKEGIKLLHYALTVNQNDAAALKSTMDCLAEHYHNLFADYARAAFWYEKSGKTQALNLANCYYQLGNKAMAKALLTQIGDDNTRHCSVVKLWGDIGEPEIAIKLAEKVANNDGEPDNGFLAAGDVCRKYKRFPEAVAYYQKVVGTQNTRTRKEDFARAKKQAQDNIDAIKVSELLDLKKIKDGAYKGVSESYSGPLEVTVTVTAGKISDCKVTRHIDKQYYNALYVVPQQIIEKQGIKGVDTYASATITSTSIINSTVKALCGAMNAPAATAGK